MIHDHRQFRIQDVPTAAELAVKLTHHTWTGCTGFRFGAYLFLNDALSGDGSQEYAIIREADGQQVESVTFSWLSTEEALTWLSGLNDGSTSLGEYGRVNVQTHPHGPCYLCR